LFTVIFITESILLFRIHTGNFTLQNTISLYNLSQNNLSSFPVLLALAIAFFLFGMLCLLILFNKSYQAIDEIIIKNKGEIISIPFETIKNVVMQMISLNSHLKDIDISITQIKKDININIACSYKGNRSIMEQIEEVKEIVKGEIKRVFSLPNFKLNFQLDEIIIDHSSDFINSLEIDPIPEESKPDEEPTEVLADFDPTQFEEELDTPTPLDEVELPALETKTSEKMPWD